MLNWIKNRGAVNAPKNTQNTNNINRHEHNRLVNGLQQLRNIAWQHAIEYRFDPVLSRAHAEYLDLSNNILKEYET